MLVNNKKECDKCWIILGKPADDSTELGALALKQNFKVKLNYYTCFSLLGLHSK